ncbi:hydrogen peroxide-inducible genes activator [Fulvimarina sp. MAC8]|uniref:hydrogen peroxide-inducible genes activator n=1 Tax=Fulvimarina sp. MAC8 TaxID=3162874 RepID=UPI0032EFA890
MLTLRQIRYFETLARTLHFGRAAKILHISQPALSAQIAQMEAFFGTTLFSRMSGGVALTADGELVGERVKRILAEVNDLEGFAARGKATLSGRMRVGMIATVAPYLLPHLLEHLADHYPDLDCEVRESVTDRLLTDLNRGEIDCAIVALPLEEQGLEALPLFDDPFLLAAPAAIADRLPDPFPPALLGNERIILLEEGHCLRSQALDVCRLAGGHELATLGATSLTTVLRMVAGGLGATLIPKIAVTDETRGGGIAILPFQDPAPFRRLVLVFRPTTARLPDLKAFAEAVVEAHDRALSRED